MSLASRLYFVRHGQSASNLEGVLSHRVVDLSLTELGREQARATARWFLGRPVARVYTSPLRRARETAMEISLTTGCDVVELDGLREVDVGELDGRSDRTAWELYNRTVSAWREGTGRARFPGGESLDEALLRICALLDEVLPRHPDDEVVLVGHGEIFGSVLSRLLHRHSLGGMAPASITAVRRDEARLTCESWASTDHLAG